MRPGLSTAVNVAASKPIRRTAKVTVPGTSPLMRKSPLSPVMACTRSDLSSVISAPGSPTPVLSVTLQISVVGRIDADEYRRAESGFCACSMGAASRNAAAYPARTTRGIVMALPRGWVGVHQDTGGDALE